MQLQDVLSVVISDYVVGVSKGTELIEEFDNHDESSRIKYNNAIVTSIHVLNEDTIAINVEV